MLDKSQQRQFDFLCEKLVHEVDSGKILELVKQINVLLGPKHWNQEEEAYVHLHIGQGRSPSKAA